MSKYLIYEVTIEEKTEIRNMFGGYVFNRIDEEDVNYVKLNPKQVRQVREYTKIQLVNPTKEELPGK